MPGPTKTSLHSIFLHFHCSHTFFFSAFLPPFLTMYVVSYLSFYHCSSIIFLTLFSTFHVSPSCSVYILFLYYHLINSIMFPLSTFNSRFLCFSLVSNIYLLFIFFCSGKAFSLVISHSLPFKFSFFNLVGSIQFFCGASATFSLLSIIFSLHLFRCVISSL